jgi:hypothetical protein
MIRTINSVIFSLGLAVMVQPVAAQTNTAVLIDGMVQVQLSEYQPAFRNPMKGFREFFQPGVDKKRASYPYPYGSIIKEYMQWNMIENDADDGVDKIIAYSNHRWKGMEAMNMKVIPRVYLVWVEPWHGGRPKDPNNPDDLSGTHWPNGIPEEKSPYKQNVGNWGAHVDPADKNKPITGGYFDPSFPARVKKLVEKLGKAWDNDPRVAYVEMGIIGEWGEHHDPDLSTYWAPHDEPDHVANRTWIPGMEKVLGDAFSKAFKNKKVMVRYAYEFKDHEFGIYWDSWSQPDEEVRGYAEMRKLGDRWKTQPIGGEITWNWGTLAKFKNFEQVVIDPEFYKLTMKQIRNLHCNHLGGITWANFEDKDFKVAADKLQKAMGYRFVLNKAAYTPRVDNGKILNIRFELSNTGSSPFYYNWPVQVVLLEPRTLQPVWRSILKKVEITQWMPGDEWDEAKQQYSIAAPVYTIDRQIKLNAVSKGKYILALSINDPASSQPSLRFANGSYLAGGYTALGMIGVGEDIDQFALPDGCISDIQADTSLCY